jgi:AcrR family transcriptional regulator
MALAVPKTREKLIDVARQLFARMGVDGTTMNDIAMAARKGRRTVYTYFNSKKEIYNEVVETEVEQMYRMMDDVVVMDIPADDKLQRFIYARLNAVRATVIRNGTLRAKFFRDIWRVEKARKDFDRREIEMLTKILSDGIKEGIFSMPDPAITAMTLHYMFKGLEVPYIRGVMGETIMARVRRRENVLNLIFNGIKLK